MDEVHLGDPLYVTRSRMGLNSNKPLFRADVWGIAHVLIVHSLRYVHLHDAQTS